MRNDLAGVLCLIGCWTLCGCSGANSTGTAVPASATVTIGAPLRETGLEAFPSVPLNGMRSVDIAFNGVAANLVSFKVVDRQGQFVTNATVTLNGTKLDVSGVSQTDVHSLTSNPLKIQAVLTADGRVLGESPVNARFAVCAHPNGIRKTKTLIWEAFLGQFPGQNRPSLTWGVIYTGRVDSDSGFGSDLNAVQFSEKVTLVTATGFFNGDHIQRGWRPADLPRGTPAGTYLDLHGQTKTLSNTAAVIIRKLEMDIDNALADAVADVAQFNQSHYFCCDRCRAGFQNGAPTYTVAMPASGYQITNRISKDATNRYFEFEVKAAAQSDTTAAAVDFPGPHKVRIQP